MEHVLNNPAWSALSTGNKHLAQGTGGVKFFDSEVSPFAALKESTAENFHQLYLQKPDSKPILFISPVEMDVPKEWKVLNLISGYQMVHEGDAIADQPQTSAIPLTEEHIPQMLALTKLTNPGPFAARTIDFGHYMGIFENGKLAAMAGQRLHAYNYQEISAVCTHPDQLGKGYARQLLIYHINRIKAAGGTPFLHVRYDNERAIKVYESLGFKTRISIHFYFMQKDGL